MRLRVCLVVLVAVVIALLTGCGGSSKSSSSGTSASVATATTGAAGTTTTNPGALARRFAARDECLRKNGIRLPKRTPGQRPPGGGLLGGGSQPPKGMTRAQYQAILTKCGLALPRGGALGSGKSRLSTPTAKRAFNKFVACMRANGINMPAANTSGTGPVFSAKGLAIGTAKFDRAEIKCRVDLRGAFRARPTAGGAPKGAAVPPTQSSTKTSSTPGTSGQSLTLAANTQGQLKYNTGSLTAKAGKVSIDFTNTSPLGHNVTIESSSGNVIGATPTFEGGSKTLAVTLKAGTYKFFCSVPGHRMAGMEGTLTVHP